MTDKEIKETTFKILNLMEEKNEINREIRKLREILKKEKKKRGNKI